MEEKEVWARDRGRRRRRGGRRGRGRGTYAYSRKVLAVWKRMRYGYQSLRGG